MRCVTDASERRYMLAVIFEVNPTKEGKSEYLQIAAELRKFLENRDGFISIERFQSLTEEGKILSLSAPMCPPQMS